MGADADNANNDDGSDTNEGGNGPSLADSMRSELSSTKSNNRQKKDQKKRDRKKKRLGRE